MTLKKSFFDGLKEIEVKSGDKIVRSIAAGDIAAENQFPFYMYATPMLLYSAIGNAEGK